MLNSGVEERFNWTPEAVERLKKMYNDGKMTRQQMADALGCGRSSVIGKINRLQEKGELDSPNGGVKAAQKTHAGYGGFRFSNGPRSPQQTQQDKANSAALSCSTENAKTLIELGPRDCRHIDSKGYCGKLGSWTPTPGANRSIGPYCEDHMRFYCPQTMARAEKQKSRL